MRPVSWKELRDIAEAEGCQFDRQRGDHYVMTKPGMHRPIVIPRKNSLSDRIVLNVAKQLGLDRKGLQVYLDKNSKKKTGK